MLKHVLAEIAFVHSTLNTSMSPSNPIGGTALDPVQNSKKSSTLKEKTETCIKLAIIIEVKVSFRIKYLGWGKVWACKCLTTHPITR